jgi:hypothetical protein
MIPRSPARKRAIARLLFWVGWVNMLAVALVMASVLVWGRGWPSALWAFIGSR